MPILAPACVPTAPAISLPSGRRDRPADGVLVTRPADAAADTASRLQARGWRPVFAPVAEIDPIDVALPPPDEVQAVLVTSANALATLPVAYNRVPLLAVGDATASRARDLGFSLARSASGDALALADLVRDACVPSRGALLHVCGRDAPDLLASELAGSGFKILRREVYFARPAGRLPEGTIKELERGTVAAALFFSPASARRFIALVRHDIHPEALETVTAIAISAVAAEALAPLPWRRIRVASRPNQDELLAQLP